MPVRREEPIEALATCRLERGSPEMIVPSSHHIAASPMKQGAALLLILVGSVLGGCAIHTEPKLSAIRADSQAAASRAPVDLFVFLDGTANSGLAKDARSATNVWKLFQLVKENGGDASRSFYAEGVGTARNPLSGMVLGKGMEKRIKLGYEFLARNYRPGDRIYIFGFSRGAHQARALAGLISYAGLPVGIDSRTTRIRSKVNSILEVVKDRSDEEFNPYWRSWVKGSPPPLGPQVQAKVGLVMQPAEVEMLGLWDTVPGSMFKHFGTCAELPNKKGGDRYKSGSYPPIRQIAQATSRDEKRSRFGLLRVCPAINAAETEVSELWFPGAHADIGGGYDDSSQKVEGPPLSNAPLNWITGLLADHGAFENVPEPLPENFAALAHWPVGSRLYKVIASCVEREEPPPYLRHSSLLDREAIPTAPILLRDKIVEKKYPATCGDMQ